MKVIAAFGKRRGYDLEYCCPELITAVDEETMDENPRLLPGGDSPGIGDVGRRDGGHSSLRVQSP